MSEEDCWVFVPLKKGKKSKPNLKSLQPQSTKSASQRLAAKKAFDALHEKTHVDVDDANVNVLTQKVKDVAFAMKDTPFFNHFITVLRNNFDDSGSSPCNNYFHELTILGIGNFSSHHNHSAMLQMCFAYLLQTEMLIGIGMEITGTETETEIKEKDDNIKEGYVRIFDPVFSELEKRACELLGMTLVPNLSGHHPIGADSDRALFFMPHCPYALYSNLVWENWDCLGKLVIIGNSFEGYCTRKIETMEGKGDCIRLTAPLILETNILLPGSNKRSSNASAYNELDCIDTSFNDTCLMRFPTSTTISDKPVDFARPSREDLENWNRSNDPEVVNER